MQNKKAVALAYSENSIPQVVAKGQKDLALKIIQKAQEFNIPIFQNEELANSLIKLDLEDFIREEQYLAVAKILMWLYENEQGAQFSR